MSQNRVKLFRAVYLGEDVGFVNPADTKQPIDDWINRWIEEERATVLARDLHTFSTPGRGMQHSTYLMVMITYEVR